MASHLFEGKNVIKTKKKKERKKENFKEYYKEMWGSSEK